MNDRIKELYDQASIRYSVYEILKPQDERKSIPDIFSELIIRECAKIAADSGDTVTSFCISDYFGVEE